MNTPEVVICWNGLPAYAARCIATLQPDLMSGKVRVIGTRPDVPLADIESHLGATVIWLDPDKLVSWEELGLSVPRLFVHTGWAYPVFNALAAAVRAHGGHVAGMVDNRFKRSLRQGFGALYFRGVLRRKFHSVFVPGKSAARLMRFFGMPSAQVFEGLYGADGQLFASSARLPERPRRIAYVGRYIERKGLTSLCAAWQEVVRRHPSWELVCFGEGPMRAELERLPRCLVRTFGQPDEIAAALAQCRFLILPSLEDHWGLVVHEAALNGCGLVVSDAVGAAEDLVSAKNGKVFRAGDATAISESLDWACTRDDAQLLQIEGSSRLLGESFGPVRWKESFTQLCANAGVALSGTTSPAPGPVIVGLDLVPANGGPYKSVRQFRKVLGGTIVSFTGRATARDVSDGIEHLISGGSPWEQWFLRVPAAERRRIEPALATANLWQCHILFRHHAHWVRAEARRRGVPYWVIPHGCLDPWVFTYRRTVKIVWMRIFGRAVLRDAASVIFATRREAEKAAQWLPGNNSRIVPWPVEPARIVRNDASARNLRQRLGLPRDARLLLWLGRLHPMKRPLETISQFGVATGPNDHLLVVGPTEAFTGDDVAAAAERAGAASRVHWLGPIFGDTKHELVAGCDGYISLSHRENFNYAAAESLAAGLPVILSRGNDLGPEVADQNVGWILRETTPESELESLRAWARTPMPELLAAGARGRVWAERELSFARFSERLRVLRDEDMARFRRR